MFHNNRWQGAMALCWTRHSSPAPQCQKQVAGSPLTGSFKILLRTVTVNCPSFGSCDNWWRSFRSLKTRGHLVPSGDCRCFCSLLPFGRFGDRHKAQVWITHLGNSGAFFGGDGDGRPPAFGVLRRKSL